MFKKRIAELCMKTCFKFGCKCDAQFSNVHYSGYKVMLTVNDKQYRFRSYSACVERLNNLLNMSRVEFKNLY